MERTRHRKSQSAKGIEGPHRIQKHRLSSDSYNSNIDGSTRDNMYKLDLGQSSPPQSSRSPMAKCLAEEMYKDTESKRRSSSLISRLTGLEGLSSLWYVHRRQKRLSKSHHHHGNASITIQPNREIDDEDFERSPHFVSRRCSSRWSVSSMLTKSEMALMQDKYMDAKRISADHETIAEEDEDFLFVNHLRVNPRRSSAMHEPSCSERYEGSSHLIHKDGRLLSCRTSKTQAEEKKDEENLIPRKILVLRSSTDHAQGYFPPAPRRINNVGFSKPVSREAQEIAREITRRMRDRRDETLDAYSSVRGYAADESDFEKPKLSSRNSFSDDNIWGRHPSTGSVNREAKKRLSERWKITNKYRDLELVSEGSTLGEMLERESPLGISSRDSNSKEDINKSSSRSSSLPHLIGGRRKRKVAKGKNLCRKESKDSKSRSKKTFPFQHVYMNHMNSSSKADFEIQMEANVKDLSEQYFSFQMPPRNDSKENPVSDVRVAEHGSTSMQPPQKPFSCGDNNPEDFKLQEFSQQPPEEGFLSLQDLLEAEQASSESSKELDRASPISVFEVPLIEDMSSCSESFERVNAELNELRMQLQLLKLKSGAYDDVNPTENDITRFSSGKSWKVNYAIDVLIHSCLQEFGFDIFRFMWHSQNCALNPELFENLEKKYNDNITGSTRSERKLLFDSINSAVLEIFQQHVDLYPWVMPKLGGILHLTWQKERVRDAIEKLIDNGSGNMKFPKRVLDKEMQWMNFKGEIDLIGIEIEKLLIDDVIGEFLYFLK